MATPEDQMLDNYGTTIEWAGYKMKRHAEHKDGVIVLDSMGCNAMPGATWFRSTRDAQKGIAALVLSKQTGGDFWMFMELTRATT